MNKRCLAGAASALEILLGLAMLVLGPGPSVLDLTQPSPAYAGAVRTGSMVELSTTGCAGDCDGHGQVTVDDILDLVFIALGNGQAAACAAGDVDHNQQITVNEIVAGVNSALKGCPVPPVPTATPTATPTAAPTATATITPGGPIPVADAVARNSAGVGIHLNQVVTTEGTVTVAAGVLANKKLKVFAQDGGVGIMVFHPDSGSVTAYQRGDRIRVKGKIIQADPSGENVLTGTVMIDVSVNGAAVRMLSQGNPIPAPRSVTLHDIVANGFAYMGGLVAVQHVQKIAGNWPILGGLTTSVTISDDAGATQLSLRFQKNTITPLLTAKLNAIGNGPFNLVGIAVQDAVDGNLTGNFEIWIRGADDLSTP